MITHGPEFRATSIVEGVQHRHKLQFVRQPTAVKRNKDGTTGWARVLETTDPAQEVGRSIRVHKCAHNPCNAIHPDSKHGLMGPPLHVQEVNDTEMPAVAVVPCASASSSTTQNPIDSSSAFVSGVAITDATCAAVAKSNEDVVNAAVAESKPDSVHAEVSKSNDDSVSDAVAVAVAESTEDSANAAVAKSKEAESTDDLCPPPLPPPVNAPPDGDSQPSEGEFPLHNDAAITVVPPSMIPASAPVPFLSAAPALELVHTPPGSQIMPTISGAGSALATSSSPAGSSTCPAPSGKSALEKLLTLAREISKDNHYIGYSAFILMGLRYHARPMVWEGESLINLIHVFAPWAYDDCTKECPFDAVCCAVVHEPDSTNVKFMPVSESHPLHVCRHYISATRIPCAAITGHSTNVMENMYQGLGVYLQGTVMDGDCGIDVMTQMLAMPETLASRQRIRQDLSEYLMERADTRWMQELMVACQELSIEDLTVPLETAVPPLAAAAAVADGPELQLIPLDDETRAALRWATNIRDTPSLLHLVQSLPPEIVKEQVIQYRRHIQEHSVAKPSSILSVSSVSALSVRFEIAKLFHEFLAHKGHLGADGELPKRIPHGSITEFCRTHLKWISREPCPWQSKKNRFAIQRWHRSWRASTRGIHTAVADPKNNRHAGLPGDRMYNRKKAAGQGRPYALPLVREALYEWWAGMRYAIDWKQLSACNRNRGKHCLARFPRAVLRKKVSQLIEDFVVSALKHGERVTAIQPDSRWFRRWEKEYGLSMRRANRKYACSRPVLKSRLEIDWLNIFSLRYFIFKCHGYDPVITNSDQSPFHNNETGAQNKVVLAVKGSKVPVVEGNSDVKSRWTVMLTTCSDEKRILNGYVPPAECMYKAAYDGHIDHRLQAYCRSRGVPEWLTATTSPKGSYREQDVVTFHQRHWSIPSELSSAEVADIPWTIHCLDYYAPHTSPNVRRYLWSQKTVLLVHPGGVTPYVQTPDTDANEDVRRRYGDKEAEVLIDKLRLGDPVPSMAPERSMEVMRQILSDTQLHLNAAKGFKKVGFSIDLFGKEDHLVCREAGEFWNEVTTDGYPNMRAKINAELQAIDEEISAGSLPWCQASIDKLIRPWKPVKGMDDVLQRLGEDFYHDEIHRTDFSAHDDVVSSQESSSSDSEDVEGTEVSGAAVADATVAKPAIADAAITNAALAHAVDAPAAESSMECHSITGELAELVHNGQVQVVAFEETLDMLKAVGAVRAMQCVQRELTKHKRTLRNLSQGSTSVANAFLQLRRAHDLEWMEKQQCLADQKDREVAMTKAIEARDAAIAETKKRKREIVDYENMKTALHAMKQFPLSCLGAGKDNAGGVQARNKRFEVLDRLAKLGQGLSPEQRNDWQWFKESWDDAMVKEYKAEWARTFAGWIQLVIRDEASNAMSKFVHRETLKIVSDVEGLKVP